MYLGQVRVRLWEKPLQYLQKYYSIRVAVFIRVLVSDVTVLKEK